MVLVTGGSGYIGTHTLIELHIAGYDFIVYDNLSNSNKNAIKRVEKIIDKKITFIEGDIRDKESLKTVFSRFKIDSVVHFAGLKAVGESVAFPLKYYENNVSGSINLLMVMNEFDCKKIIFSSSATVYGESTIVPIKESFEAGKTTNPYGRSKYIIEKILDDIVYSDIDFKVAILRYFNPVGAYKDGSIGENPNGIPNNLMPYISGVAVGKLDYLRVFGNNYNTIDGTGVRDYIHVMDLANAHVKALDYINSKEYNQQLMVFNIGTGRGYSVLELLKAYERANNISINYKIVDRRDGDIASCYADVSLAKKVLKWEATRDIEEMCGSSYNFQKLNPNGYEPNKEQ